MVVQCASAMPQFAHHIDFCIFTTNHVLITWNRN